MAIFFLSFLLGLTFGKNSIQNPRLGGVLYSASMYADLVDENGAANGRKKCTTKSNSIDNLGNFVNDVYSDVLLQEQLVLILFGRWISHD